MELTLGITLTERSSSDFVTERRAVRAVVESDEETEEVDDT